MMNNKRKKEKKTPNENCYFYCTYTGEGLVFIFGGVSYANAYIVRKMLRKKV